MGRGLRATLPWWAGAVAALSLGGGRVTLLHGVLHLVLALVFVFLTIEP